MELKLSMKVNQKLQHTLSMEMRHQLVQTMVADGKDLREDPDIEGPPGPCHVTQK